MKFKVKLKLDTSFEIDTDEDEDFADVVKEAEENEDDVVDAVQNYIIDNIESYADTSEVEVTVTKG